MRIDTQKPAKLSAEEQKVAEKMIKADITKSIPLSSAEWQDLQKLLGSHGVIIESLGGDVTVYKI